MTDRPDQPCPPHRPGPPACRARWSRRCSPRWSTPRPSPDALDAQYEGRAKGYTYAREGHPNAEVLAAKIDVLEGATGGIVTGSGMAAIAAVFFGLLKAGDHVLGAISSTAGRCG